MDVEWQTNGARELGENQRSAKTLVIHTIKVYFKAIFALLLVHYWFSKIKHVIFTYGLVVKLLLLLGIRHIDKKSGYNSDRSPSWNDSNDDY